MNVRHHSQAFAVLVTLMLASHAFGTTTHKRKRTSASSATKSASSTTKKTVPVKATSVTVSATRRRVTKSGTTTKAATTTRGVIHSRVRYKRRLYSPWTEPTFADSISGDDTGGEDPLVRKAAVDALGPYNGTVVVADPQTGRLLSVVNQKLALTGAFQPCSTIKVVVSLASLSEGLVEAETPLRISRRYSMNMTQALARSNNTYFAKLGEQLGFERVTHYAQLFGLGEKAGLDIANEEPGTLASEVPADGIGMMTSFGSGIRLTPLELASIVTTVANGGTMYYLQYPRTEEQIQNFQPKVKRYLDIENLLPAVRPGMMGAVEFGTARRAVFDAEDPMFGKTGTCTDTVRPGVHLGWFGSFNEVGNKKLVVVVLLTGGRGVSGPVASGVAGQVYRNLAHVNYFGVKEDPSITPFSLLSMHSCCQ
jgi:penicillin-binding protein 2